MITDQELRKLAKQIRGWEARTTLNAYGRFNARRVWGGLLDCIDAWPDEGSPIRRSIVAHSLHVWRVAREQTYDLGD